MTLQPGRVLSHYTVVEPLGKGGMGEVYRARDSQLGRDVAIKVIPDELAQSDERLRRFQREGRILASLNHPNIASIHGLEQSDGTHFLVMELVEGETLADCLPLSFEDAIRIFHEIAEALEAAHDKGILHRDLKPSNVMITTDGRVKLLDFGLAKALAEDVPEDVASQSPTATKGTALGVILGTAAYMSPEQARGRNVDRRTDVWAFGCCLYEALSGQKAFAKETVTDTLGAVVHVEPDWSVLPSRTPARMRELLEKCLRKDKRRRLQHIGDARVTLEDDVAPVSTPSRSTSGAWLAVPAAILAAAITWFFLPSGGDTRAVTRSRLAIAPGTELKFKMMINTGVAISHDGRTVAYVDKEGIYVRELHELEWRLVPATRGAGSVFFSPDDRFIGFNGGDELMKVPVSGGAPVTIAKAAVFGPSWGDDGKIVFAPANASGLFEVDANGGELDVLSVADADAREKSHRLTDVLPGGRSVVFGLGTGDIDTWDEASIAVVSKDDGEHRVVVDGGASPRYSPSGHLLYARDGAILAVPFDSKTLEVRGTPVTVVEGVASSPIYAHAEFAISRNGTLVYVPGGAWGGRHRVVTVNRNGSAEPLIDRIDGYVNPSLSPDERSLAIVIDGANVPIWSYDLVRGTMTRLASGYNNYRPVWTSDGTRIAFQSNRGGTFDIYSTRAEGGGDAEVLVASAYDLQNGAWLPDGTLAYVEGHPDTEGDIWILSPEGEKKLFLGTAADERSPRFSPDGRFIAYESNDTGRREIYLRAFPDSGRRWLVSTGGGAQPLWSRDGTEIFYRNESNGDEVWAVTFESAEEPVLGNPTLLFERSFPGLTSLDVMSDGRFIAIENTETEASARELILVQNFDLELERLAPHEPR